MTGVKGPGHFDGSGGGLRRSGLWVPRQFGCGGGG